jgi:hypothetical protein
MECTGNHSHPLPVQLTPAFTYIYSDKGHRFCHEGTHSENNARMCVTNWSEFMVL